MEALSLALLPQEQTTMCYHSNPPKLISHVGQLLSNVIFRLTARCHLQPRLACSGWDGGALQVSLHAPAAAVQQAVGSPQLAKV